MNLILELAIGGILVWIIPGAIGGLLLAVETHRFSSRIGARGIVFITAGWSFGFAMGGGVSRAAALALSPIFIGFPDPWYLASQVFFGLEFGIIGLIAGAIGAWVMYSVLC